MDTTGDSKNAPLALQAGKNIRWVADQLGHSDPSITLQVYSRSMPADEIDLSFASFNVPGPAADTPKRPQTAPAQVAEPDEQSASSLSDYQRLGIVERETGFEPATLSLGS